MERWIAYKLAVLIYKVRSTSTPVYYIAELQNALAAELYVQLPFRCFPVFSTDCLELAATYTSHQ